MCDTTVTAEEDCKINMSDGTHSEYTEPTPTIIIVNKTMLANYKLNIKCH